MSENDYELDIDLVELEMISTPFILKSCLRNILVDSKKGFQSFGVFVQSLAEGSPERRWAFLESINILGKNLITNVSTPSPEESEKVKRDTQNLTNATQDSKAGMEDGLALLLSPQPIGEPLPDAWLWYASNSCPVERYSSLMLTIMSTSVSIIEELARSQGVSALVLWDSLS